MDLEAEIEKQRAEYRAAGRDNNRLRATISDKQLEVEQLEKQIRKLERKIDVLEDADRKRNVAAGEASGTVKKGFFKPMPRDYQCPPVQSSSLIRPQVDPLEKARITGQGIVIDSATGQEVHPSDLLDEWEKETNPLLRISKSINAEERLMQAMRNPPDVNADFDTAAYSRLVRAGKQEEAEEMLKREGGPTSAQMQKAPLSVLKSSVSFDPNWCDSKYHGCSLAQWACSVGYDDVLRELLVRRADPSHQSQGGVSCLAAACSHNHISCAKLLLEHRVDPNEIVEPENGQTIVMWASRIEYSKQDGSACTNPFVLELLKHRADPNGADRRGMTALMHASTAGNAEVVAALLEAKADVDAQDNEGRSALEIALRYYHGKISAMLVPLRKKAVASSETQGPFSCTE